jgi:hypothetical protein
VKFRFFCYGDEYAVAEFDDFAAAKRMAEEHIRDCPKGPMPWATDIRWHFAEKVGPLGTWVSAAYKEWLNHQIEEVAWQAE